MSPEKLPQFYDRDELELAVDRVGAGMGQKARWGNLSIAKAQQMLRDSIEELLVLRGEHTEWACPKCRMTYMQAPGKELSIILCPTCRSTLRPYTQLRIFALESRVRELESQVRRLEESLEVVLDLGPNDEEELDT